MHHLKLTKLDSNHHLKLAKSDSNYHLKLAKLDLNQKIHKPQIMRELDFSRHYHQNPFLRPSQYVAIETL